MMKKIISFLFYVLACFVFPASGQVTPAYYSATAMTTITVPSSPQGYSNVLAPVPYATITVCGGSWSGQPCLSPTVNIYQDKGLTKPFQQPLTADAQGNFSFWYDSSASAPPSYYTISGQNVQTRTYYIGGPLLQGGLPFLGTSSSGQIQSAPYLPVNKAGDTMTGPLILSGAPTQTLEAATKDYVDTNIYYNVRAYGAVADAKLNSSATILASSNTVTTTGSPTFASSDVGKTISLPIGASGAPVVTTITGFNSANSVTIGVSATTACSGCNVWWGTDDTTAFNNANIASGSNPNGTFTSPGGRAVYVPPGAYLTTAPIYVRGGSSFIGAGQTASQIINVSTGNIINMGENSSGAPDGSGLETNIYGLMLAQPFSASACSINIVNVSGWNLRNNNFASGGTGVCIPSGNTMGIIAGNTFDSNVFNDIVATGDGATYNGTNHDVQIIGNNFFFPRYSAVELEGVSDYQISLNSFSYCYQYCINGTQQLTNSRIGITGNTFTIDGAPTNSASENTIYFATFGAGGLAASVIANNTFYGSNESDIYLDGSGTADDVIAHNTFTNSSQQATSSNVLAAISIPVASTSPTTIRGNVFVSPGGYAVTSFAPIVATGNRFSGVFAKSGVPSPVYAQGAIITEQAITGSIIVRNNSTDDTTYPVYSNEGGAQTVFSSGNRSGYSYDVVNGDATISTINERVQLYGGAFANVNVSSALGWGGGVALGTSSNVMQTCGTATFTSSTTSSAVSCSWVTTGSRCQATWIGTVPTGANNELGYTPSAGSVTLNTGTSTTGTASVACSVN